MTGPPPAPRPTERVEIRPGAASPARLAALRLLLVVVVVVLVGRLWQIQIVQGTELRERAQSNRFVPREIEADRGVIYDAAGEQVVLNEPRFTVSIVPAALAELPAAEREAVLNRVAAVLRRPLRSRSASPRVGRAGPRDAEAIAMDAALGARFGQRRSIESMLPRVPGADAVAWSGWGAIPVDRAVTQEAAFELLEAGHSLPGIHVEMGTVRQYKAGASLAHILGFTGPIPQEALGDYLQRDYRIYDIVGRDGLEATYEHALRGDKGQRTVMVDVMGRVLNELRVERKPRPGDNLHLTVELSFQKAVEEALRNGLAESGARAGAVAALDPRDGAIRALVTVPNYDNNLFSAGASPEDFVALLADPGRPLVNRAISGQPPGSIFKLVTAAAALQEGVIGRHDRIFDPGVIRLPNQYNPEVTYDFVCWLRTGHGALDVVGAMAHSCDVYFYQVSGGFYEQGSNQPGLGSERLARYSRAFGLGRPTEVELFGEAEGLVPTPRWLADWKGEVWTTGLTYHMGIGQGDMMTSPLQMANVVAAVVNGGVLYRPHLVARVERVTERERPAIRPGGELGRLPIDEANLAAVREGMLGAVRYGTSQPWLSGLPTEIAIGGKTGTAEICDYDPEIGDCRRDANGNLLTHAWFIAYAPADDPTIALAVLVDGSGMDRVIQGSEVAAPIAADIIRHYFDLPPRRVVAPEDEACPGGDCEAEDAAAGALDENESQGQVVSDGQGDEDSNGEGQE